MPWMTILVTQGSTGQFTGHPRGPDLDFIDLAWISGQLKIIESAARSPPGLVTGPVIPKQLLAVSSMRRQPPSSTKTVAEVCVFSDFSLTFEYFWDTSATFPVSFDAFGVHF